MRPSQAGNNNQFRVSSFGFLVPVGVKDWNYQPETRNQKLETIGGFSLLELIAVVTIIGFALAVTAIKLNQGFDGLRLKASAKDIVTTLRYAREKAISEQAIFKVGFDVEQQQVTFSDEVGANRKVWPLRDSIRFKEVRIDNLEVRSSQQLTSGLYISQVGEIFFLPTGSSNKGEIVLESGRGGRLTIVTDFLTGSARIVK